MPTPKAKRSYWNLSTGFSQKKLIASLMAAALLMTGGLFAPGAWAQQKKQQDKQKVDELQSKRNEVESKRQALQRKKDEKLREAKKHDTSMVQNQWRLDRERRSLQFQQRKLEDTKNRLVYLDVQMDQTMGEATRMTEDAGKRMRSLYMGERISMLQMILEANDISSLLDRVYYKKRIVAQDQKLLADLRRKIDELQVLKKELAVQKDVIAQTIQNIQVSNMQIQRSIEMDRSLRDKYRNDAQFYERAERQLLAESQVITTDILRLTQGEDSVSKASVASSGSFMWPLQARISSRFGHRTHPIHKKRLMHTGLDIAGPNGAAIKAADGGVVIHAGWKGGYGKTVMINHGQRNGKSLVTLYAHMSHISVSKGQTVSKGQVVGKEGMTGYATGPHLHFEVRVNGAPVDPMGYLK